MNLIIDVGNTRAKLAVFNAGILIHAEAVTKMELLKAAYVLIQKYSCKNGIIATVAFLKETEITELHKAIHLIELNSETKIPFKNNYSTPQTLGTDRIALVAAAVSTYKNSNVLIIDAGTCITYDFVSNSGEYEGGAISPGIEMRYKSLNYFTSKLPLLQKTENEKLIGNSTAESIHSGVINGVIYEIDGIIDIYNKKYKTLTVVLTGGDVNFLAIRLKNSIFANPNFILEGLHTILTYNLN